MRRAFVACRYSSTGPKSGPLFICPATLMEVLRSRGKILVDTDSFQSKIA